MRTFAPSRHSFSRRNGTAPVGSVIKWPRLDTSGLNVIDTWIYTKKTDTDWARTGGAEAWYEPLKRYCTPANNAFLDDAWSKGYRSLPAGKGGGLESVYTQQGTKLRPLTAGQDKTRAGGKVYDPYTKTYVPIGQDTKTLMEAEGKVWDPYQKAWVPKGSETIFDPTKGDQTPGTGLQQTGLSDDQYEDMGEPPIVYALLGLGVLGLGATAAYFLFFRKPKKKK